MGCLPIVQILSFLDLLTLLGTVSHHQGWFTYPPVTAIHWKHHGLSARLWSPLTTSAASLVTVQFYSEAGAELCLGAILILKLFPHWSSILGYVSYDFMNKTTSYSAYSITIRVSTLQSSLWSTLGSSVPWSCCTHDAQQNMNISEAIILFSGN